MKQLITILFILISLTGFSQTKSIVTVSGSSGGSNVGDSVKKNTDTLVVYKGLIYPNGVNIQKNTDSIAAHTARLNSVTTSTPSRFDIIATGQSNMVNNDITIGTWTYTTSARVQSFTSGNVFATANPATNNIDYIGGQTAERNNIGFQFGKRFVLENTLDTIRILDRAQGSSGSWLWTPKTTGNGEATTSNIMLDSLVSAISRTPANFNAKVILYHQGEADEASNSIYYLNNLFEIYDTLKNLSKVDDNYLMVIGYPTTTYPQIQVCLDSLYFGLKDLAGRNIAVVPINTTTTNTIDGTHYTNETIDYIGRWDYYAYQQGQVTRKRNDTTNAFIKTSLGQYTLNTTWIGATATRPFNVPFGVYSLAGGVDMVKFSTLTTGAIGAHQALTINDYSSTPKQISIYHASDDNAGNNSTFRNGIAFRDSTINILDSASRQSMLFGNTTIGVTKPITSNSSISTSAGVSSITNNITTASSNIAPLKLRSSQSGTGQSVGIEFGTSVSSIDAQIFGETGVKSGVGDLLFKTSTNLSTMVERMRITGTGLTGIGYAGPDWQFQVTDSGAASTRGIYSTVSNTSSSGPFIALLKTRGTPNAPTAVTSGDVLGIIDWRGYIGSTNTLSTGVRIAGNAVGTVTDIASGLTANITFTTRNRNGFAERWRIDTSGNFTNSRNETSSAALQTTSFSTGYTAQTSTYAVTSADHTIECTSGTFTVTLPTAVGITGREYWITNTGSGTITIATTSSQTFINVTATPTTLSVAQFSNYKVKSNGANWLAYKIVN